MFDKKKKKLKRLSTRTNHKNCQMLLKKIFTLIFALYGELSIRTVIPVMLNGIAKNRGTRLERRRRTVRRVFIKYNRV